MSDTTNWACQDCGEVVSSSRPHKCGWQFITGLEMMEMGRLNYAALMTAARKRNAAVVHEPHMDGVWVRKKEALDE